MDVFHVGIIGLSHDTTNIGKLFLAISLVSSLLVFGIFKKLYLFKHCFRFGSSTRKIHMKFSIIIPTLNEQQNIKFCLQTLQNFKNQAELILVDGGSQDDTVNIAAPLVNKLLLCNKGRAHQMNVGASYAVGEILIFLHADTYVPDNALALISQGINKNKKVWGRFDISLVGSHWLLPVISFFMNWRSCLTGIATGDQVIFVTKTAFEKVKGYPNIALMEDISLSKQLKALHPPLCLKAKVKSSARRWQQFGVFKTILLMWSLRLGYFFSEDTDKLAELYQQGRYWLPAWLRKQ
jgi:rSAM/selenodomain-associated transferase 2